LLNDAEIPDFLKVYYNYLNKKKKDPIDLFISKEKPSDFNSFVKSKNNEVVTDNKKGPVIEKSS
jgi:hypothetical protein